MYLNSLSSGREGGPEGRGKYVRCPWGPSEGLRAPVIAVAWPGQLWRVGPFYCQGKESHIQALCPGGLWSLRCPSLTCASASQAPVTGSRPAGSWSSPCQRRDAYTTPELEGPEGAAEPLPGAIFATFQVG